MEIKESQSQMAVGVGSKGGLWSFASTVGRMIAKITAILTPTYFGFVL